jgi:transcription elongation factor Elf1
VSELSDAEPKHRPPLLALFECPTCHKTEAVETAVRFGRTTYYCPNCQHLWDVPPLDP